MNVGKWIVVAFILFAGFIATLVTVCMRQDISLVSGDYYKQELAYQQQIDRASNTATLKKKPVVQVNQQSVQITFDSSLNVEQGEVKLFCPSDSQMDRTFKLTPARQQFTYDVSGLKHGMYRVKLFWTMTGKEYYQEEIINL